MASTTLGLPPAPPVPRPRRVRAVALALVLLVPAVTVVALALTGALAAPAGGLLDPGALTRWALPAATALRDVAATVTVGVLALVVLAMPPAAADGLDPADADELGRHRQRVVRWAAVAAAVWAVATVAVLVLTASDLSGLPLSAPGLGGRLLTVATLEPGRLLVTGLLLALVVAVGTGRTTSFATTVLMALLSAGALLPLAMGGHSASEADHATAVNTTFAHLVGVTVWTGGLVGLVALRLGHRYDITATARRFSVVAGACFAVVAVSGVWRLTVRLDGPDALLGAYGAVLAVKVVALGLLGVAGALHRRRLLARLSGEPAAWWPFVRLVGLELVVLAVATGLGVALSRTPLP